MARCGLCIAVLVAIVAVAAYFCCCCRHSAEIEPVRYPEPLQWGDANNADTAINPFTVSVPKEVLEDLKKRIDAYKPVKPLSDVGYTYGMPADALASVVKLWREKYDWAKAEAQLNSLPQFKTVIHGLNVHFIHAKANVKDKLTKRIPLLIVHGWPGSVLEFYDAIKLLVEPKDGIAYDVVAPSIPGYGFSDAPTRPGFNPIAASQVFGELMKRLGYAKYIYQGGDWGAVIGNIHARMFPDNVLGFHSNMVFAPASTTCDLVHFTAAALAPALVVGEKDAHKVHKDKFSWLLEEMGYMYEQSTKPDTIGAALSDSPVGLAAYILEKFATWSQNVEFKTGRGISNENMITNVMIYWVTGHATTAIRFYKETAQIRPGLESWMKKPYTVPTAVACYPGEIMCAPKSLLHRQMPRLVHYEDLPTGGHFAAFEVPQLFVDDLRRATAAILEDRAKEQAQPKQ